MPDVGNDATSDIGPKADTYRVFVSFGHTRLLPLASGSRKRPRHRHCVSIDMKLKVAASILSLAAIVSASRPALSANDEVAEGHRYFIQYCASCHGQDGLGDGPVAKSLLRQPGNLRTLGDKYGMPLPAHRIAELIDGRDTIRAHGTRDMPVWGERLYEVGQGQKGETGIGDVIAKIIAYLGTIQDRRTAMR